MQVTIDKKKFTLSFGMICWEQFYLKTLAYEENKTTPSKLDGLADLIDAAIDDANEVLGLNQKKVERKNLKIWINAAGVTEKGAAILREIESGLTNMVGYKSVLKSIEDKKKAATP